MTSQSIHENCTTSRDTRNGKKYQHGGQQHHVRLLLIKERERDFLPCTLKLRVLRNYEFEIVCMDFNNEAKG